jgi:hypothetical protein
MIVAVVVIKLVMENIGESLIVMEQVFKKEIKNMFVIMLIQERFKHYLHVAKRVVHS